MNKIELDLIVLVPDHCLCIYFVNNYSYSGLFNVFRYINEKKSLNAFAISSGSSVSKLPIFKELILFEESNLC